jgi:hypothetical protein
MCLKLFGEYFQKQNIKKLQEKDLINQFEGAVNYLYDYVSGYIILIF